MEKGPNPVQNILILAIVLFLQGCSSLNLINSGNGILITDDSGFELPTSLGGFQFVERIPGHIDTQGNEYVYEKERSMMSVVILNKPDISILDYANATKLTAIKFEEATVTENKKMVGENGHIIYKITGSKSHKGDLDYFEVWIWQTQNLLFKLKYRTPAENLTQPPSPLRQVYFDLKNPKNKTESATP